MITDLLINATLETLYMSLLSTFLALIFGMALAILLVLTRSGGLAPMPQFYRVLGAIVNAFRSFPFIILMIVLFPLTKLIVGTSIGTTAAIVPLTIGSAPFIARLLEAAMLEVDKSVIEAARSFGASRTQIVFRVLIPEALPAIVNALTLTLIVIIGFSAMAGTVGGGGLGDVAVRYGYQRFRPDIMIYTVIILIVMVQLIQMLGDFAYKRIKK